MAEMKKHLMTREGLQKLKDELEYRKVQYSAELSKMISEAKEQGDLSENAEYDAARDEQTANNAKIEELEHQIKMAEVIDESAVDKDIVRVGCFVKLYDVEFDEELEFKILGTVEANILNNIISNESPMGRALMGRRIGEEVVVPGIEGDSVFKILDINISK